MTQRSAPRLSGLDTAFRIQRPPSVTEARAIAKEAVIFGFPLLDNYRILHSYFVNARDTEFKAPWNQVRSQANVYGPEDHAVQAPNADTPYSILGADLRTEPLVLTLPTVEGNRYFSAQFIDLYTHNFAYAGSRATGNESTRLLLAGPTWKGEPPDSISRVVHCETEFALVIYRTQLFGPADLDNVKRLQAGYQVQTLSRFLNRVPGPQPPRIAFPKPLHAAEEHTSLAFFNLLNFVLQFCPVHATERELMERLGQIGIGARKNFDARTLSPSVRQAVREGMADAWKTLEDFKTGYIDTGRVSSGDLAGTRESLKNNYLYRMAAAVLGIYGNSKAEAIFAAYFNDSTGLRLDGGTNRYSLRFLPGRLPPVNAFWSLTMYQWPSALLCSNAIDRYLINSAMLPDMVRDLDGGLTIHVQHDSPGRDRESNWLPAPRGPFMAALRLYWPRIEALEGRWTAPPMERSGSLAA
jgi:hypothetical protein